MELKDTTEKFITIKLEFRLKGHIPDLITNEEILSYFDFLNGDEEFTFDGRNYPSAIDAEEWVIYPVDDFMKTKEIKSVSIEIDEDSNCEHCGNLEPFSLTFYDGNTCWCESCFNSDIENEGMITKDTINEYREKSKDKLKEYYTQKLKNL